MNYLYYCNSAYQIMASINLHWQRKEKKFENIIEYGADLLILNNFEGAESIAKNIKKLEIFNNVILIEKITNEGAFHLIKSIKDALFPASYLSSNCGIKKRNIKNKYDIIVVSKYSTVCDAIARMNKNSKIHLIEDGMGTYFSVILLKPKSKSYIILKKMLNIGTDFSNYEVLYLDRPDYYIGKDINKIRKIPNVDDTILELYKKIFNVTENYYNKKIFWFCQNLENDEYKKLVNNLLSILRKYKEETIIRPHPRYPGAFDMEGFDVDLKNDSWEIEALNIEDIQDKLLISVHSTACFTPKMLFNREPYILLFYKLFDRQVSFANDNFDMMIDKIINSYSNKEKIMIPNTVEEFKECLEKFDKIKGGN